MPDKTKEQMDQIRNSSRPGQFKTGFPISTVDITNFSPTEQPNKFGTIGVR